MKGIGDAVTSNPASMIPSDWRDVNQSVNRLAEFQKQILEISDKSVCCFFHVYDLTSDSLS